MKRFDSPIKKHLINVQDNLYISKGDMHYEEKILRYVNPTSTEAHFKLGEKLEAEGMLNKARLHYQEAARLDAPEYLKAKRAIKRLDAKLNEATGAPIPFETSTQKDTRQIPRYAKLMLLTLLALNILLLMLLFSNTSIKTAVSSMLPWGTGLDVVYESVDVPYIIYIPSGAPHKEIEKQLYDTAISLSKSMPQQTLQLYGISTSSSQQAFETYPLRNDTLKEQAFVIAEYNSAIDSSVRIRFLHPEFSADKTYKADKAEIGVKHASPSDTSANIVGANLVRTALQTYIEQNGASPTSLDKLVGDFPSNYLSFIPIEAFSMSNNVSHTYTGSGGWVYNQHAEDVSQMFYPNTPDYKPDLHLITLPYFPIEIIIDKAEMMLYLINGPYLLEHKPVGLGKANATPEGSFRVLERVLEPLGETVHSFGIAGLGLGEIAIHGTSDESSIQAFKSLGCIRVSNEDMLDIFDTTPLGAAVHIVDDRLMGNAIETEKQSIGNLQHIIPDNLPQHTQTTDQIFYWAG